MSKYIKSLIIGFILWGVATLAVAAPGALPSVSDIRAGEQSTGTRLVVEMSKASSYKVFYLENPTRLVIDIPEVVWHVPNNAGTKKIGLIKGFRYGLFSPGTSRIVVDLDATAEVYRGQVLPGTDAYKNDRIVLDLKTVDAARFAELGKASMSNYKAEAPKEVVQKPTTNFNQNKPVIVIDAGHGGPDPGSIGGKRTREKDVTLAIAREIRKQLVATGKYKVIMTRDRDIFIKLAGRVDIARQNYADLFVSIHADSHPDKTVSGLSVYTLSETASDKEAAKLAARENKADLIAGVDLGGESTEVSNILIDLAQRETMNLSARFAQGLVKEFGKRINLLRHTHRFAGFAVLKAPDIPSVLIETGYLSNVKDERMLMQPDYQRKIGESLTRTIGDYFSWRQNISSL